MKQRITSSILIAACFIISIASLVYARRYEALTNSETKAARDCDDDISWSCTLADYLEASMSPINYARFPFSIKYLLLSRLARDGKIEMPFEELVRPTFLADYGVVPEVIMHTDDIFLKDIASMTPVDAKTMLDGRVVASGKDLFNRTVLESFPEDTVLIRAKDELPAEDVKLLDDRGCTTSSTGIKVCYRHDMLKDIAILPAMIFLRIRSDEFSPENNSTAVLLGAKGGFEKSKDGETDEFRLKYVITINGKKEEVDPDDMDRRLIAAATTQEALETSDLFEHLSSLGIRSDKPIILYFSRPGCPPCGTLMKKFAEAEVKPFVEKYRIIKLVQGSSDQNIMDNYDFRGFPTLCHVDAELKKIAQISGDITKADLIGFLKRGLK